MWGKVVSVYFWRIAYDLGIFLLGRDFVDQRH